MDTLMEISRDIYLRRLADRRENGLIKVITGIRRCGKSYLLNTLFYRHLLETGVKEEKIIRFAFDSAEDLSLIGEDIIAMERDKRKADPGKFMAWLSQKIKGNDTYYLLLDEVQNLEAFESVLNSYLRHQNLDIYVTGSNSKFLSSDIITEFAGRGDEIHVHPLSFAEYYTACKDKSPVQAFDDYMTFGGLPFCALISSDEQKAAYLDAQMKNVYLRDIVRRYGLQHEENLRELVSVVASDTASLTNPAKLSRTFDSVKHPGLSAQTIDRYISFLEEAFLIKRALRFDVRGRKYINTPYKLYFEDTGLRNAQLSFRQLEPAYLMENIIYNELRLRGFSVDVGVVPIRETGPDGKEMKKQLEIDFVANKGSQRYYIQSAWMIPDEAKRRQELRSFDMTRDSFKKILISGTELKPRRDEMGYVTMGVIDFLLDAESLER
ncbi:MAG TPA: ATP-binding protein [Methanocorpusculum sp.]|nr:ATP-binding protein [Candidatus Methanocorpusculum equi]HJJ59526.1 ATP-binding protein [Methanocorpusculum sp.]